MEQSILHVSHHGLEPSESLTAQIEEEAASLTALAPRATRCHVTVEVPHRHQRQGRHFRVRVELSVPGTVLVSDRDPAEHAAHEDAHQAVREAFGAIHRQLEKRNGRLHERRSSATDSEIA